MGSPPAFGLPSRVALNRGFTLLELLVALFIASMIMSMVYVSLKQQLDGHRRLAVREQQLRDQAVIQQTLLRDFANALPGSEAALRLDRDSFGITLNGSVVPGMQLGPEVEVKYSWQAQQGSLRWGRSFVSRTDQQPIPGWQFFLQDGLTEVHYELRVGDRWINPDDFVEGTVRALRWTFHWSEIGQWTVIASLLGVDL